MINKLTAHYRTNTNTAQAQAHLVAFEVHNVIDKHSAAHITPLLAGEECGDDVTGQRLDEARTCMCATECEQNFSAWFRATEQ